MVSTPSQGFDDPPQRPCDPLLPVADPPLRCRSAAFCPKLDCVISRVYDQSPMKNHLGQRHQLVNASRHKITVGGNVPVCKCAAAPRVLRLPERSLNEAAAQTACGSIRATAVRMHSSSLLPLLGKPERSCCTDHVDDTRGIATGYEILTEN